MKVRVALAVPDETFKPIVKQAAKEGLTISEFFEAAALQLLRSTGTSKTLDDGFSGHAQDTGIGPGT